MKNNVQEEPKSRDTQESMWDEVKQYYAQQSIIRRGLNEIFKDVAAEFKIERVGGEPVKTYKKVGKLSEWSGEAKTPDYCEVYKKEPCFQKTCRCELREKELSGGGVPTDEPKN